MTGSEAAPSSATRRKCGKVKLGTRSRYRIFKSKLDTLVYQLCQLTHKYKRLTHEQTMLQLRWVSTCAGSQASELRLLCTDADLNGWTVFILARSSVTACCLALCSAMLAWCTCTLLYLLQQVVPYTHTYMDLHVWTCHLQPYGRFEYVLTIVVWLQDWGCSKAVWLQDWGCSKCAVIARQQWECPTVPTYFLLSITQHQTSSSHHYNKCDITYFCITISTINFTNQWKRCHDDNHPIL